VPRDFESMRLRPIPDRRHMSDRRAHWRGERRTSASIRELARRIRTLFGERPDLRLTSGQAAHLWHVDAVTCESVLEMLVQHDALSRTPEGHYIAARAFEANPSLTGPFVQREGPARVLREADKRLRNMPPRPCPLCGEPARLLADITTDFSVVDYYRCDPCGHVWWHPKNDPNAPAVPVTPPPVSSRRQA
jgi:hypothetical protein